MTITPAENEIVEHLRKWDNVLGEFKLDRYFSKNDSSSPPLSNLLQNRIKEDSKALTILSRKMSDAGFEKLFTNYLNAMGDRINEDLEEDLSWKNVRGFKNSAQSETDIKKSIMLAYIFQVITQKMKDKHIEIDKTEIPTNKKDDAKRALMIEQKKLMSFASNYFKNDFAPTMRMRLRV
jgi:hypothetical protein